MQYICVCVCVVYRVSLSPHVNTMIVPSAAGNSSHSSVCAVGLNTTLYTHSLWLYTQITPAENHTTLQTTPPRKSLQIAVMEYVYPSTQDAWDLNKTSLLCGLHGIRNVETTEIRSTVTNRHSNPHSKEVFYKHFQEMYRLRHKCSFPRRSQACTWGMHKP